jgi:hypothetical protein
MNATWGADPDALDRLAAQVDSWATLLSQYRVTLNAHIHSAPWHGQEADRFRQTWSSRLSPSLASTVSALQTAHVALQRNAEEQRNASGAGSTSALPKVSGGISPSTVSRLSKDARSVGAGVLGVFALHGAVSALGSSGWAKATRSIGWLRTSGANGIVHGLTQNDVSKGALKLMSSKAVQRIEGAAGIATVADKLYRGAQDIEHHDIGGALSEASDAVSSGLESSKIPTVFLAGVDVKIWTDVIKAGHQIDWTEGVPNPLSGDNLRTVWAPAFGNATVEVAKRIPGYFGL